MPSKKAQQKQLATKNNRKLKATNTLDDTSDHYEENDAQPVNWHDDASITDVNVPWLYEAHSVLLLLIVLSVIFYFTFTMEGSIELGFQLVVFLFIAVGCLIFPAGPFIRPHPIVWRFIFSISVLYSFCLLLLLSQNPDNARALLRRIFNDESLGYPLEERSYAVDCTLSYSAIVGVLDRFLLAHLLGWAIKAAFIRNRAMSWIISVTWEFVELATKYFIPNFAECWWDQWILDVLLCNGLGIELGLWLAKEFNVLENKEHSRDWFSRRFGRKTVSSKFKRLFLQFTPEALYPMNWEPLSSFTRYLHINLLVVAATLIDFNAFVLKLFLYIPTEHPLNVLRVALFVPLAVIASKQYYLYIIDKKCKKLGSQTWIIILCVVLETALCYKCAPEDFPPMPWINKVCLSVVGVVYLLFTYVMISKTGGNPCTKQKQKQY